MLSTVGLGLVLLIVLLLPLVLKKVEENLEVFLCLMGLAAATLAKAWTPSLAIEALKEPLTITAAVFLAGLLFKVCKPHLRRSILGLSKRLGTRAFSFLMVLILGLISSVITAIIAALFLVEIIDILALPRKSQIRLAVISCFAIGLGAVLTPLGEPLAAIVVAKLRGQPYFADFWFLFREFCSLVLPALLVFALLAAIFTDAEGEKGATESQADEGIAAILLRAAKTYVFVLGLVLLGAGFKPLVDRYIAVLPAQGLFWINSLSAVLDNATLAAAEMGPGLSRQQLVFSLMGLLVAGGMLIPGNIPNIIAAGKLKIRSREWIAFGLPLGLAFLIAYFIVLSLIGK